MASYEYLVSALTHWLLEIETCPPWWCPVNGKQLCTDKYGCLFEVRDFGENDFERLVHMYDDFSPKGKFQGVPPLEKEARRNWTLQLVSTGINLLALREGCVVGHVVLIPEWISRDAEYLIFVNQRHRNRGIGTRMTEVASERARQRGLKRLWLAVESYNYPAISLYRKCGFCFCQTDQSETERIMDLKVP